MRKIVYFSPVAWDAPWQRPHHFVEWSHRTLGSEVLWVEPVPERLPRVGDLHINARRRAGAASFRSGRPDWLHALDPRTWPIEPLPIVRALNRFRRDHALDVIGSFAGDGQGCLMVVGKPSLLALAAIRRIGAPSVYDAMDNFPEFYRGLSRVHMHWLERQIVSEVGGLWASSQPIADRWASQRPDLRLVPNGVSSAFDHQASAAQPASGVLGYVGTVGDWFAWDWVCQVADSIPERRIELVGPIHRPHRTRIPENVDLLGARSHEWSMRRLGTWEVGLIPFLLNKLTFAVDPVKFYEYRASGLPVISTPFGSMADRTPLDGVLLAEDPRSVRGLLAWAGRLALSPADRASFIQANSWDARFGSVLGQHGIPTGASPTNIRDGL